MQIKKWVRKGKMSVKAMYKKMRKEKQERRENVMEKLRKEQLIKDKGRCVNIGE